MQKSKRAPIEPTTAAKRAAAGRALQSTFAELDDVAALVLGDLWDKYTEMKFEDAIANMGGIAELISGNSAMAGVARDIKTMVACEARVSDAIRARVIEIMHPVREEVTQ